MSGSSQTILLAFSALAMAYLTVVIAALIMRKRNQRDERGGNPRSLGEVYSRLSQEIKSAVTPKFLEVSVNAHEITDLAVEIWRIEQRITKSSSSLPENQLKGLENSIQKLKRYLEKYDIEIVDYRNTKYNAGLNLDILSVEKDPTLPESIVKETVEPTILLKGQVVRKAKIILLSNH